MKGAIFAVMLLLAATVNGESRRDPSHWWGQWRGPHGTGVAPHGDPPERWSEGENIRWKTNLPGRGLSSPIVWENRIFLTASVARGERVTPEKEPSHGAHNNDTADRQHEFIVFALDSRDGSSTWKRVVHKSQPHEGTHETGSWASASPVTDGEHLFAFFGSNGLYALDMKGEIVWEKDLGDMEIFHEHGEGSSPALHGDTLVVNWDHQGESFIVAFDKSNGEERWRNARDEITSWASPLIIEHGERAQVVTAATNRIRSYDLVTGKLLWEHSGLSRNVVATPVAGDGTVYVASSYNHQAMFAIDLAKAKGEVAESGALLWSLARHTPYVPSPLLYGERLYFVKHIQGFLSAVQAKTGKRLFGPRRLDGMRMVYASPVGAAGRIYVTARSGRTVVFANGDSGKILAANDLADSFAASPAIVGDTLYLRGARKLYAITRAE